MIRRHVEEGEVKDGTGHENNETVKVRKISTVELFDRKSQSSLEEVSMDGSELDRYDSDRLVVILSRSEKTLRILNLSSLYLDAARMPRLVDCRLLYPGSINKIRLTPPLIDGSNHYKVLWISTNCKPLFESHLHLLDNLVSLKVEVWKQGSEWRSILDKPSRTLKHLTINVQTDYSETEISHLVFPALQVLEIESQDYRFPSWFRISHSPFTLINNSKLLSNLPSISTLWVDDLTCIDHITDHCPELMILRANVKGPSREKREARKPSSLPIRAKFRPRNQFGQKYAPRQPPQDPGVSLNQALEERKGSVKNGMEVDGIKMKQIKALIVPFEALDDEELEGLSGLVEEVIDLKTSSRFVEVEI